MSDQLYDIPTARELLGNLGRTKFFELTRSGKLRTVRIGRRTMVPESEIQRYITQLLAASDGGAG